jgi:aspartyl-tRNA(Asn)/glutamyl-tRNA(Gln) amidotransferase subunit B
LEGGARVEVKNISSFKEVEKALNYEILRQKTFSGNATSETRHWDERRSITIALRSKEAEQDYRYFPEPDLPPIFVDQGQIAKVRRGMPEVADAKAGRYEKEFGLSSQLAKEIAANRELSAFFEESARLHDGYKEMASLIVGELSGRSSATGIAISPEDLVGLVRMMESNSITRAHARDTLREALRKGKPLREVVRGKEGSAVVDERAIAAIIEKVVAARPEAISEARKDKKAFNYLVGQVLKEEPRAQPAVAAKLLARRLRGK